MCIININIYILPIINLYKYYTYVYVSVCLCVYKASTPKQPSVSQTLATFSKILLGRAKEGRVH